MNLPPDRASAIAGGRKCPRLPLTFQAEPQNEPRGWGCTSNHQLVSNKWLLLYATETVGFFVTQQKLTDTNCILVCVCVCVCARAPQSQSNWNRNVYSIHKTSSVTTNQEIPNPVGNSARQSTHPSGSCSSD